MGTASPTATIADDDQRQGRNHHLGDPMDKEKPTEHENNDDLNPALLAELIEDSRVTAVSQAVQEILALEAATLEPEWVLDGQLLSDQDYLALPSWQRTECTRTRIVDNKDNKEE